VKLVWYLILLVLFAGCAWVTPAKTPVNAHWIDANESAPFSGLLIDENTYKQMRVRLLQCQNTN